MMNRLLIIPKVFTRKLTEKNIENFFLVSDMTTTSERFKNRLEQLDAFEVKFLCLEVF